MAEEVEAAGIKVDWINKVMGEILQARDHQKLAHIVNLIRSGWRSSRGSWMYWRMS